MALEHAPKNLAIWVSAESMRNIFKPEVFFKWLSFCLASCIIYDDALAHTTRQLQNLSPLIFVYLLAIGVLRLKMRGSAFAHLVSAWMLKVRVVAGGRLFNSSSCLVVLCCCNNLEPSDTSTR